MRKNLENKNKNNWKNFKQRKTKYFKSKKKYHLQMKEPRKTSNFKKETEKRKK